MTSRMSANAFRYFDRIQEQMCAAMMPKLAAQAVEQQRDEPRLARPEKLAPPLTTKLFVLAVR